ncbi:MAG: hypothetical protein NVS2B7_08870 [Herpetosiphon sp.]
MRCNPLLTAGRRDDRHMTGILPLQYPDRAALDQQRYARPRELESLQHVPQHQATLPEGVLVRRPPLPCVAVASLLSRHEAQSCQSDGQNTDQHRGPQGQLAPTKRHRCRSLANLHRQEQRPEDKSADQALLPMGILPAKTTTFTTPKSAQTVRMPRPIFQPIPSIPTPFRQIRPGTIGVERTDTNTAFVPLERR